MSDAVGLESAQWRIGGVKKCGEASGRGKPPNRGQVRTCGPQEVKAITLGLWGRELVGKNVAFSRSSEFHCSDDAGGVANDAVLVGSFHAIHRERGLGVVNEDSLGAPAIEQSSGITVGVVTFDRKIDPHHVGGSAGDEGHTIAGADHVIRRSRYERRVERSGVVTNTNEWFKAWHRVVLSDSRRRPARTKSVGRHDCGEGVGDSCYGMGP